VRDPGDPPPELVAVQVCPVSGRAPGSHCPLATGAFARVDAVPTARCSLHDTIEVDLDTGLRVGAGCREGRRTERRTVVVWPDAVARFLTDRHRALPAAPPWHPDCTAAAPVAPLRAVHPRPDALALLLPGLPATDQEIPLEADGGAPPHTWFVDGVLVGTVAAGERAWWAPRPGAHEAVVQDARGRTARVPFRVEWRR
jgi:penicillin-binding protein 1C